jgi:putative transcriptional regulator
MIRFKINILDALRDRGYNSTIIRKQNLLGQAQLQKLREGRLASWGTLDKVCDLLNCQPGDILEFVKENTPE